MKTFDSIGAQGDVLFIRRDHMPENVKKTDDLVVAHSETGHHHVARAKRGYEVERFTQDSMVSFLRIRRSGDEAIAKADQTLANIDSALSQNVGVEVVHHRSNDTHETVGLECPSEEVIYEVRRQREMTPSGWRQAID